MTEQELRVLVREAIEERRSGAAQPLVPVALIRQHASHGLFMLPSGDDMDGPCLIEPAVRCNHCGYCKSYGH